MSKASISQNRGKGRSSGSSLAYSTRQSVAWRSSAKSGFKVIDHIHVNVCLAYLSF
jgi:hypothetical protein